MNISENTEMCINNQQMQQLLLFRKFVKITCLSQDNKFHYHVNTSWLIDNCRADLSVMYFASQAGFVSSWQLLENLEGRTVFWRASDFTILT